MDLESRALGDICTGLEGRVWTEPNICNMYYDCSSDTANFDARLNVFPSRINECEYPKMFDMVNLECRMPDEEDVVCGLRRVITNPCDGM